MANKNKFKTLLGTRDFESFVQSFREKKRFHGVAEDRGRFETVLPWPEINRFIEGYGADTGRLKVIRDGQVVPAGWYTSGTSGAGRMRAGALLGLVKSGVSIGWDHVTNDLPLVADLCADLERHLSARVWANAYLSFHRGGAFKVHYDAHDVLVLQLHGGKRWTTYGTPVPSPVAPYTAPPRRPEPVWTGEVLAGDVLFVPRGEVHSAEVIGEHSVHLTIAIQRARGLDFVAWLLRQCETHELFRMDVLDEHDLVAFNNYQQRMKETLASLLGASELGTFLAEDDQERRTQPRLHLGSLGLTPETLVIPTLLRPVTIPDADTATGTLRAGGQDFRLSPLALKMLIAVTNDGAARLGDLAVSCGASAPEAQAALNSLLELGLAAIQED